MKKVDSHHIFRYSFLMWNIKVFYFSGNVEGRIIFLKHRDDRKTYHPIPIMLKIPSPRSLDDDDDDDPIPPLSRFVVHKIHGPISHWSGRSGGYGFRPLCSQFANAELSQLGRTKWTLTHSSIHLYRLIPEGVPKPHHHGSLKKK